MLVAVAGPEDPLHGVAAQRSLTGSPTWITAGIDWMTSCGSTLTSVGTIPVGVLALVEVKQCSEQRRTRWQLHDDLFGFASIDGRQTTGGQDLTGGSDDFHHLKPGSRPSNTTLPALLVTSVATMRP